MAGSPIHAPAVAAQVPPRGHTNLITLRGRTTALVIADQQGIAHVTGSGRLSELGPVTLTSTVDSHSERPLLSTPSLLHADVVITNPKGQVNVRITLGTLGMNPFAQPVHLQYFVQGGTGAYRNAAGKGMVDLTLFQPIPTTLDKLKQMGDQLKTQGIRFSLDFHPGHPDKWGDFSGFWFNVIKTAVQTHDKHSGGAALRARPPTASLTS